MLKRRVAQWAIDSGFTSEGFQHYTNGRVNITLGYSEALVYVIPYVPKSAKNFPYTENTIPQIMEYIVKALL